MREFLIYIKKQKKILIYIFQLGYLMFSHSRHLISCYHYLQGRRLPYGEYGTFHTQNSHRCEIPYSEFGIFKKNILLDKFWVILQKIYIIWLGCPRCTLKEIKYLCVIETTPTSRLEKILHSPEKSKVCVPHYLQLLAYCIDNVAFYSALLISHFYISMHLDIIHRVPTRKWVSRRLSYETSISRPVHFIAAILRRRHEGTIEVSICITPFGVDTFVLTKITKTLFLSHI